MESWVWVRADRPVHTISCRHTGAPGNPLTGLPLSCWHRLTVAGFHGFSPLLWAAVIQKAHIFFTLSLQLLPSRQALRTQRQRHETDLVLKLHSLSPVVDAGCATLDCLEAREQP